MVSQMGVMSAIILTGVSSGYKTMDEIPDSCTPSPLVPNNGRCMFSYQCASGFCCPFFKSCLGDNGYEPLSPDAVMADPLRKKMMYTAEYGGEASCGKDPSAVCDVCDMRECSAAMTCDMCITVDAGDGAKPMLEGNDYNFPPYDIGHEKCRCHADFVKAFEAGTWVEACGGGSPAPAASAPAGSPAPAGDSPAPAPPTAVADSGKCAGLAFGTAILVAIAFKLH
eukprot:gnl/MRDRNA2_/MRDRNA2_75388_c0_seq2.p1 gnl/MRDRNA2_/MRDRNA2_75388_c0~~gnl/MRDRNA2_/MRDRNA2_75388_c0_seq2.p1  ORF type:complete len:225 (+),score=47.32 gnl/MRDRNA2_/MRDRNA2_75388_c0_seq2:89-763(+)